MTAFRDLKKIVRARQQKTGESYTTARAHVIRERDRLLGNTPADPTAAPERAEAAMLAIRRAAVRVRIRGEAGQVTFRSRGLWNVVPGQVVTLTIARRWTWRDDAYASGTIENPRIDVGSLGLEPLPLRGGDLDDLAAHHEPFRAPDPYAPLWRRLTARPRPSFEFDATASCAMPSIEIDADPTGEAMERAAAGDFEEAQRILMDLLCVDLRCLDAHAHLGNLAFDDSPEHALLHFEVGMRIGELSLPAGFDGFLTWGQLYNRPFLRCLHGYGLCLWRLGRTEAAQQVFERILALNPSDNQGVRFCWQDLRNGRSWQDAESSGEVAGGQRTSGR